MPVLLYDQLFTKTTNADLGNYQKKWRYALMVISLFVVGLLVKIFRR